MRIHLFDLDGVLIYPGGYRAALKATVNHFSRALNLGDGAPADETIELFEACGITSEWDSSPICVAVMLTELWRAHPRLRLPRDFAAALATARAFSIRADWDALYAQWARRIAEATRHARAPSQVALGLFMQDAHTFSRDGRAEELIMVLRALLEHARDFARSPTMRVFQTYTLGSARFAEHYGVAPQFETPSLIRELDKPALSAENRAKLRRALWARTSRAGTSPAPTSASHFPVIYTLRPCKPETLDGNPADYPPEAELALALIGLEDVPLIGFGHLYWLAQQRGVDADTYGKPSPVHALAAIARAIGGSERAALRAAVALAEEARLETPLAELRGAEITLTVFEDSAAGVRGVLEAARLLNRAGAVVSARAIGVTTSAEKRAALEAHGAQVFADVNEALAACA